MTRTFAAAAALITIFILFVILGSGTVFAQDVISAQPTSPPPPPVSSWAEMVSLIRESFTASLLAAATAGVAWLSTKVQKWFGGRINLQETMEAVEWEKYVDDAARKAFAYAQMKMTKMGVPVTPETLKNRQEKDDFVARALLFMEEHYDDIVGFVDSNHNSILDVIEARPIVDVLEARLAVMAPPEAFAGQDASPTTMARSSTRRTATADVAARFAATGKGRLQ